MTILNGFNGLNTTNTYPRGGHTYFKLNHVKAALRNNPPVEDKLHVVVVMSNPSNFATRYDLTKEFIKRMEMEEFNVELYIVELAYGEQKYFITEQHNPRHLQLRATDVLWHKENMINLGVQKLLPKDWQAMAWIDADIEFENTTWASDTLKLLNGCFDVVQLFSHACDLNETGLSMTVFNSLGYCLTKNKHTHHDGINFSHPGYAWAIRREAYDKIGGLYEHAILGSADHIMAKALVGEAKTSIHKLSHPDYFRDVLAFEQRAKGLRMGYTPGVIRHYWHGSKVNRKYVERWQILVKHDFNPLVHLTKNAEGLLISSTSCPKALLADILQYGNDRKEDEGRK
jgi:hypothetical protein